MDHVRIRISQQDIQALLNRYGPQLTGVIQQITLDYTEKTSREAKLIIRQKGHVDTGQTIAKINPSVRAYANMVVGQVNAGTNYSRFIHEGAEHESDTKIVPHFVPFKIAPSLLLWAKRKKIIYQKTKTGAVRKRAKSGEKWYMKSRSGNEFAIDLRNGGLPVSMEPTFFFKDPFDRFKNEYIRDLSQAMR